MTADYHSTLPQVIAIARTAGSIISSFYLQKNFTIHHKADHSPVTDADLAAHHAIATALAVLLPWPIISEEGTEFPAMEATSTFWLVDPLDGTREFLQDSGQFTVNIALIVAGAPVLGVVYAPMVDELYYASSGCGAFLQSGSGAVQRLACRPLDPQLMSILISNRASPAGQERYRQAFPGCELIALGSSLKFCYLAAGKADLYLVRGHNGEWDTAAAQCLIEEAGGVVLDMHGHRLKYGKPKFRNEGFVACADPSAKNLWVGL